jgi:DNA processing protein
MGYCKRDEDLIIIDSLDKLTYRQKVAFVSAIYDNFPEGQKNKQLLIKTLDSGVYNKLEGYFNNREYRQNVLKNLEDKGITCVCSGGQNYPKLLLETPVPPLVLYCKGNVNLLNSQCFSIVGSRLTLANMMAACKRFSSILSRQFTIVTGISDGADSAVIEGALEGGNLICVMPGGLDYIYPASNAHLVEEVAKKALVISEFPPKTSIQKYMFSVRNRIIAGMSVGTLVVSAAKKSGALITAGYAIDYGREVFAFPYNIGITSGEGCNSLIKKGAYLVDKPIDILSTFGLELKEKCSVTLVGDEYRVLSLLRQQGEAHLEQIAASLNKQLYEVTGICSSLEIKGLAVRIGGNKFAPAK